jgi:deoxycytidine triphosphate deaminase
VEAASMKDIHYFDKFSYEIPGNLEEAEQLAKSARLIDPFPKISPSLLNKHDIIKYVSMTGMIFPFDPIDLKSASYEVKTGKEFIRWVRNKDGNLNKEHRYDLSNHEKIPLIRNSITFVDVDATFFIPFYIALRFNLSITHVHRGLLLGTGPLIDPGFNGKIMIPIHNLTNNDYYLKPGSPLIAVEFTKVTSDEILQVLEVRKSTPELEEKIEKIYKKNIKAKLDFNEYLLKALPDGINSVESSVGIYINEASQASKVYQRRLEIFNYSVMVGFIIFILTFAASIYQIYNLTSDVNKYVADTENNFRKEIDDVKKLIIDISINSRFNRDTLLDQKDVHVMPPEIVSKSISDD